MASPIPQLAKIGARSQLPGNMHRALSLQCLGLCTSKVTPRLCVKEQLSTPVALNLLLPHKLFAAMFHNIPKAFESSVLGGDEGNRARFWRDMQNHPIVTSRQQLRNRPDLNKVVPLGMHGDSVQYMQANRIAGKTLKVLSWASLLAKGPTKVSSFLMFCLAKSVVKDWGLSQTWPKVWHVLCWSLQVVFRKVAHERLGSAGL